MIRPRTQSERRALLEGYEMALTMAREHGLEKAHKTLCALAEVEYGPDYVERAREERL